MSLPLIAALGLHFVLFHRAWLRLHPLTAVFLVGIALALASPYLLHLMHSSLGGGAPPRRGASIGFSFCGPVLFTAIGFERYLGKGWFAATGASGIETFFSGAAVFITALAFAFSYYGFFQAVRSLRLPKNEPRFTLSFLAVVAFAFHFLLNLAMGLFNYAHYYNGVWIFFFLFLWIGVSALAEVKWGRVACAAYVGGLAVSLMQIAVFIHRHGGSRELYYGPTLGNLIAVAKQLNESGANTPSLAVGPLESKLFPNVLPTLQKLYASDPVAPTTQPPRLIRYKNLADPTDGRVEVVQP
jgi:hypothetical protein